MIIQVNKDYRIVGFRYGWRIEKRHVSKKDVESWRDDPPAFPASLPAACEALAERIARDKGDCTVDELPQRLRNAATEVRRAFEIARKAA